MTNRIPLILNTASSTIQELPSGDNLDLSGSNISNVGNITGGNSMTATYFVGTLYGVANTAVFAATANAVAGANVSGTVANATYAVTAGTVTTAAQANITSVGTLSSLIVSGNANITVTNLVKFGETVLSSANTSTSISPDVAAGTIFRYTANANFTFNSLTNVVSGSSATVVITQDATGSRLLTSTMKFAGGTKTLSTAASAIDTICVFYDGTTYYASLTTGYA